MHWNVSIVPEKWPIFGRFLTLFPLKHPARREKNTSNMAATVVDELELELELLYSIFIQSIGPQGANAIIIFTMILIKYYDIQLITRR
jgi:hypothetical protein